SRKSENRPITTTNKTPDIRNPFQKFFLSTIEQYRNGTAMGYKATGPLVSIPRKTNNTVNEKSNILFRLYRNAISEHQIAIKLNVSNNGSIRLFGLPHTTIGIR